jgi:4'-phosphopantetheinyl transferase EntD
VARSTEAASVGIDAEPNAPLPEGVLAMVARPEERAWLDDFAACWPDVHWDRLLFSAKEAVYKVSYPLTGRWLGFDEAVITPDVDIGAFGARLLVPGPQLGGQEVTRFDGRFLACDGLIVTCIAIPAALVRHPTFPDAAPAHAP